MSANAGCPLAENSMATDKGSEWKTPNGRFVNWWLFFYDNIRTSCAFETISDIFRCRI